jgi:hypothetical protein
MTFYLALPPEGGNITTIDLCLNRCVPMLRRNLMPQSSEWKSKPHYLHRHRLPQPSPLISSLVGLFTHCGLQHVAVDLQNYKYTARHPTRRESWYSRLINLETELSSKQTGKRDSVHNVKCEVLTAVSYKTLVTFNQTTCRRIPEDLHLKCPKDNDQICSNFTFSSIYYED